MLITGFSIKKYTPVFLLASILVIIFVSYLPSLQNGFVNWDDDEHLLKNTAVRTLDPEHIIEIFDQRINRTYVPLTSLSFAIEHHFFGYEPYIYHLDNLFLHLIVILLVFIFGKKLGLGLISASVAALIFGIHPLRVESVAWITQRKDVLYSLFYLLGLLSYLRYLQPWANRRSGQTKKQYGFLVLTTIFGILSILAKPMALSFPIILLLLDWFKGRGIEDKTIIEKLPIFVILGTIGWLTYSVNARVPGQNVLEGFLVWSWTFSFYLRQFLFPFISVPIFHLPHPIAFLNPEYLLSVVVLILTVAALIRFRRFRWFIFAFGFYFFSIFFLLRFDELKDITIVADRFMYLPSAGFCLLLGLGFEKLWSWPKQPQAKLMRFLAAGMLIFVTLIFSFKTYKQTLIWKDGITLWRHELIIYPDEPIALNNLATMLRNEEDYGRFEKEYRRMLALLAAQPDAPYPQGTLADIKRVEYLMGLYKKAISSDPEYFMAYHNLGNLYFDLGLLSEAQENYQKVLDLRPDYLDTYFRLGELYLAQNSPEKAASVYEKTLHLRPGDEKIYVSVIVASHNALKHFPENTALREIRDTTTAQYQSLVAGQAPNATSFFNLGWIFGQMGDYDRAIAAYERVLDINPSHSDTLFNLGNIYKDGGRLKEAISFYERTVKSDPRKVTAYLNLGNIYGRWGEYDKAIQYYEKALQVEPQNPKAHFSLGYANSFAGNFRQAMASYEKAIMLDPDNAEAYFELATIYVRLGDVPKAVELYKEAVKANPAYMEAYVNLSFLSYKGGDYQGAIRYVDKAILSGYMAPLDYLQALEPYRSR